MIRILTLCTGNICRSPLAAQLLQAELSIDHYLVESAGTSVLAGEASPQETQRVATTMGIPGMGEHRAGLMTAAAVGQADLILGMERIHRRKAARAHPAAAKRAFTLMEFAHVTSQLDDNTLETLLSDHMNGTSPALDAVAQMRGAVVRLPEARLYDVEDPFGRSQQVYQRSARQIETAVHQIVAFFDRANRLRGELSTVGTSARQSAHQTSMQDDSTGENNAQD